MRRGRKRRRRPSRPTSSGSGARAGGSAPPRENRAVVLVGIAADADRSVATVIAARVQTERPAIGHRVRAVPVGSAAQVAETVSDVPATELVAGRQQTAALIDVDEVLRTAGPRRAAASGGEQSDRDDETHAGIWPVACREPSIADQAASGI